MMINLASNVIPHFGLINIILMDLSWTTMNTKQQENKQEHKTLYFDNTSHSCAKGNIGSIKSWYHEWK